MRRGERHRSNIERAPARPREKHTEREARVRPERERAKREHTGKFSGLAINQIFLGGGHPHATREDPKETAHHHHGLLGKPVVVHLSREVDGRDA